MNRNVTLTITSLLSIFFFLVHITDDIVRGFEPGTLSNLGGVVIAVFWLYATLMLAGRKPGYVILLLLSFLASGIPILHFGGAGVARVAKTSGGFLFVGTLLALGVTALFSLILCVHGLWDRRRAGVR